jgi:serine protease
VFIIKKTPTQAKRIVNIRYGLLCIIIAASIISHSVFGEEPRNGDWYLQSISTPEKLPLPSVKKSLVIAIVDDGVRITHKDLKDFIWKNTLEIQGNNIDDDGNGFKDDVNGWNVSDNNNIVVPPAGRLKDFYHGTHLAGIVARILNRAYGNNASQSIKIMPVKCISDSATKTYLMDGYKGIEYAIKSGADIILCAWGSRSISEKETAVLDEAKKKGIMIIASAGNFPEGRDQYPAAYGPVIAVSAINPEKVKINNSNYGSFVDISAPGINVESASVLSDTGYETREGSSLAAAIVAAGVAIIKLQHPSYNNTETEACLKNSADPFGRLKKDLIANLGAGTLNITAAINHDLFDIGKKEIQCDNPQGFILIKAEKKTQRAWSIKPEGLFKGLRFKTVLKDGESSHGRLSFYSDNKKGAALFYQYNTKDAPDEIYIPSTSVYITLETDNVKKQFNRIMEYRAESINFSELYCHGTVYLDKAGTLEDGSGPSNYTAHNDCKWIITAPPGNVIRFTFTLFDTEAKIDKLHFFNGAATNEDIMAIFSGPTLPPVFTTWSNQVLLWFVTDGENEGQGFQADFEFIVPADK